MEAPVADTMPTSNVQQAGAATSAANAKKGSLESLPFNCLQLILDYQPVYLRSSARLMLFKSSKCLAQRVLEMTPNVTIGLNRGTELTSDQAQARCRIITDLLSGRQAFQVQLWPEGLPKFPRELANRVTSLSLYDRAAQSVTCCCPWTAMTCLHTVRIVCLKVDFSYILDMAEMRGLCEALEAGLLQRLRSLHVPVYLSIQDLDRLVMALGPQVEELTCSCGELVMKVSQLAVLKRITLDDCYVTESMMQQLVEHPTLRHVTFKHCEIKGDHSHLRCRWETLAVYDAELSKLLLLPVASVHDVRLRHGLSCKRTGKMQDMENMLAQHGHKMVCVPSNQDGVFKLAGLCELMTPLIKRIKDVKELRVISSFDLCVVSWLWQAMPASVSIVQVQGHLCGDCRLFWQNLPQHVTSFELLKCPMEDEHFLFMVSNTPVHVHRLLIELPCSEKAVDWSTADLQAVAPKHLQLQLYRRSY